MKKLFFIVSLLFTVICFASPPPDLLPVPDPVTNQCAFVVQDIVNAPVYTFEAQEIAFVYRGDYVFRLCTPQFAEEVTNVIVPVPCVADVSYLALLELNKPPSFSGNNLVEYSFKVNLQNSNYGYPFGADYIS